MFNITLSKTPKWTYRLCVNRMDGEEGSGEEADGVAKAENIDTGGVKLEDDNKVEAEVGQVEDRGAEADQSHC